MKTSTKMRTHFSAIIFIVAISISPAARAQSTPNQLSPNNTTGTAPYVMYGGAHENINLATGDLNIQIPLLALPGGTNLISTSELRTTANTGY